MAMLGIAHRIVWRARAAYLHSGLELAVFDAARPRQYDTDAERA